MILLTTLSLLVIGLFAQDPDHWHSQIMWGQIVVCIWVAYILYKRTHLLAGLAFVYFTSYSIYCCFRATNFSSPHIDIQSVFDGATARSLLFFLFCTVPFIFMKKEFFPDVLSGLKSFAFINAIVMIFHRFFMTGQPGVALIAATGMIGMDSVDGTFLAIMFPFFIFSESRVREDNHLAALVLIFAMFLAKSSTVFGILCAYVLAFIFFKMKKSLGNLLLLVVGGLSVIPVGRLYLESDLLNDNGRHRILVLSLEMLHNIASTTHGLEKIGKYLLGLGTGSFIVAMRLLQGKGAFFAWLHNEFAQVFFEQGIIGLLLLLSVYFYLLWKQRRNLPMWLMILGSGIAMLLQPCFRYFLFAFPLAFLTRLSFENEINFNKGENVYENV